MKKKARLPIVGQDDTEEGVSKKLCPSFIPREPGYSWVFGVVAGEPGDPEMIPLERPEPVTEDVFEMVAPFHPSEVFRIAAPCVEGGCKNFGEEGICHLAKAAATSMRRSTDRLQPCAIRPRCLWWHQEGREACLRCPGVLSVNSKSKSLRDKLGR